MFVKEIECRSILNKSGIPSIDYALNPYVGCGHGCTYCYADFMKRFTGHDEPWGTFVDAKVNAPEILSRQLKRLKPGTISLGTVTDGYQPAERKYEVTRKCLEELSRYDFPVSILTKSSLVLRDIDLLTEFEEVDVGFTITTLSEETRKAFEPHSPSTRARLAAVRELSHAGINTWIFFGPVLPYFSDSEEAIDRLFSEANDAGADHVLIDTLNLYPKVWSKIKRMVSSSFPEAFNAYLSYYRNKPLYEDKLRAKMAQIAAKHGLPYRLAF